MCRIVKNDIVPGLTGKMLEIFRPTRNLVGTILQSVVADFFSNIGRQLFVREVSMAKTAVPVAPRVVR